MSIRSLLNISNRLILNKNQAKLFTNSNFLRTFCILDPIPSSPTKKKKTLPTPKITLILPGDDLEITTLEDAQKLSERRNLKLVKIVDLDTKTQRPTYKLVTTSEFLKDDLGNRKKSKEAFLKGDKLLNISNKISENDLNSKLRQISKWLKKSLEVKVLIAGDDNKQATESIYSKMETSLKNEGRLLQKRFSGNNLRFQIIPPKREFSTNSSL